MAGLTVMLIDSNIDALGELASLLRSRGLGVALANSWNLAREQARRLNPAALLIADRLAAAGDVQHELQQEPALRAVPYFVLVNAGQDGQRQLLRSAPDEIARRLWAVEPPARYPPSGVIFGATCAR